MSTSISIPSRNVAANYAASFRPVSVVPGFNQVKSDLAANYLMQVPMLKQQLEMEMANNALREAGSIERTRMNAANALDQLELGLKQEKLKALLGGMGSDGGLNTFDNSQLALEVNQAARMGEIDAATAAALQAQADREQRIRATANQVGAGTMQAPVQKTEVKYSDDFTKFVLGNLGLSTQTSK
jgi:hypothetical protein